MPLPHFLPFSMMQHVPEPKWLVEGLLPQGYLAILASAPKTGKTCLATALALAVGSGKDFAGLKTNQTTVLWCCLEESHIERAAMLKLWPHMDDELPHVLTSTEPLRIDTQEGMDYLYTVAKENNAGLIVIDPLYAATGGYSLSEANLARRSLTLLKDFCAKFNITALVLHHIFTAGRRDRNLNRVAESAQLAATASMQMLLTVIHESPRTAAILAAPSGLQASSLQAASPLPHTTTEADTVSIRSADASSAPGTRAHSPQSSPDLCATPGPQASSLQAASLPPETRIEADTVSTRSADASSALGSRAHSPQENTGPCADNSAEPNCPTLPEEDAGASRRLIKLSCRGRGNTINRDWLLSSDGPLDYRQTNAESPPDPVNSRKKKIVAAIGDECITASEIIQRTGLNAGTTRNQLSQLIGTGEVYVSKIDSGVRYFRTPRPQ